MLPSIAGTLATPVTTIMATSPWRTADGVTITLKAAAGQASARRTVQAATPARRGMARLYAPVVEARRIAASALGGFGTLLAEELLDLRDKIGGGWQFVTGGRGGLLDLVLLGSAAVEFAYVLGDLGVLAHHLGEVPLELFGRFDQVRQIRFRSKQVEDAAYEGVFFFRILHPRDIVRNVGPQARRGHTFLPTHGIEHAHDARGALVARRSDAELAGERGIGSASHQPYGTRVQHLSEESAQGQHERGMHAVGEIKHGAAVRAPAQMGLHRHAHDQVVGEDGAAGQREVRGGPDDLALGA